MSRETIREQWLTFAIINESVPIGTDSDELYDQADDVAAALMAEIKKLPVELREYDQIPRYTLCELDFTTAENGRNIALVALNCDSGAFKAEERTALVAAAHVAVEKMARVYKGLKLSYVELDSRIDKHTSERLTVPGTSDSPARPRGLVFE